MTEAPKSEFPEIRLLNPRDTFLSLLKTCSKLAISFWDYLGARLKIPDADRVPWLPDLIRQNALA